MQLYWRVLIPTIIATAHYFYDMYVAMLPLLPTNSRGKGIEIVNTVHGCAKPPAILHE